MATGRSPVETRAKAKPTGNTDEFKGDIPKPEMEKTKQQTSVSFTTPTQNEDNMDRRQTSTLTHSPDLMAELLQRIESLTQRINQIEQRSLKRQRRSSSESAEIQHPTEQSQHLKQKRREFINEDEMRVKKQNSSSFSEKDELLEKSRQETFLESSEPVKQKSSIINVNSLKRSKGDKVSQNFDYRNFTSKNHQQDWTRRSNAELSIIQSFSENSRQEVKTDRHFT